MMAEIDRFRHFDLSKHWDECAVHSPTLRPCSCGLETRLRDRIEECEQIISGLRKIDLTDCAAARKTLVEYETRIESLSAQVAELKARLSDLRRPTHGPCCTCQRCGKHYDDCRCSLDETCDDLAKAEVQVAEQLKQLVDLANQTGRALSRAEAAEAQVAELKKEISYSLDVLGTGLCTMQNCEGCKFEVSEVIRILRAAIDVAKEGE